MTRPLLALLLMLPATAWADTGLATWYSVASAKAEGTSGIYTASGERYNEAAMTCAMRSRDFGQRMRVCHEGQCVIVRQNDYGPGKRQAARGVVIDLTPAAYDAIGCKRGINAMGIAWGECSVTVERMGD